MKLNPTALSKENLRRSQWKRLKTLLRYVFKHNEFYKRKYEAVGINSADQIKGWNDFEKLPFLTKEEIVADQQEHKEFGRILSQDPEAYFYIKPTSGTSGKKRITTLYTEKDFQRRIKPTALLWKLLLKPKPSDRIMYIFSPAAYILALQTAKALDIQMVPAANTGKWHGHLKNIMDYKVTIVSTSPTVILNIIEEADKQGIDLKKKTNIRLVVLTGERGAWTSIIRKRIREKIGAKCIDNCASTEIGVFALECLEGQGAHLNQFGVVNEVVDLKTDKKAEKGELVSTPLWRYDFPLIRYKTGDIVELDKTKCACNLTIPRLKGGILGMVDKKFTVRGKAYEPAEFDRTVRNFPEIKEYRVFIDETEGRKEIVFVIELILSKLRRDVKSLLKEKLKKYVGSEVKVRVLKVGTLNRFVWKSRRVHKNEGDGEFLIPQDFWYDFQYSVATFFLKLKEIFDSIYIKLTKLIGILLKIEGGDSEK